VPTLSNGTQGAVLELRPLFEQFVVENELRRGLIRPWRLFAIIRLRGRTSARPASSECSG
jgi:hypothetical protein